MDEGRGVKLSGPEVLLGDRKRGIGWKEAGALVHTKGSRSKPAGFQMGPGGEGFPPMPGSAPLTWKAPETRW